MVPPSTVPADPWAQLAQVVAVWPSLPDALRHAIANLATEAPQARQ